LGAGALGAIEEDNRERLVPRIFLQSGGAPGSGFSDPGLTHLCHNTHL